MTWMKRRRQYPPQYYESWGGIFSIERKAEAMTYDQATMRWILEHPHDKSGSLSNSIVIAHMLDLLVRQSVAKDDFFLNVNARYKRRGHFSSERELLATARALKRFLPQLEEMIKKYKDSEDMILDPAIVLSTPVVNMDSEPPLPEDDNILEV